MPTKHQNKTRSTKQDQHLKQNEAHRVYEDRQLESRSLTCLTNILFG